MAARGLTAQLLMATVAQQYYVEERAKNEIADDLGISRFRVARMLEHARRDGMVRITINAPNALDVDLSERLRRAFGLRHAMVLGVPAEDVRLLRGHLATATADVLRDLVTDEDVLGIAWARSILGVTEVIPDFATCPVIQMTGALPAADGRDVLEVVRGFAGAGGGRAHVFYAPFIAGSAATARTLRGQPDVADAMALLPSVTVATVGIGAWQSGLSTIYDAFDSDARRSLDQAGVRAEVSGVFVDEHGHAVSTSLSERILGPSAEQMANIRSVIAVAYGDEKAGAVRSVLRGRWLSGLVTHSSLARLLLDDPRIADA